MQRKITPISSKIATRFWSKVSIKSPDECWEWKKGRKRRGYGIFWFSDHDWTAHRIAYYLSNGPFDETLLVLHKCDNRSCCNFKHLFLGTHQDNATDAMLKKRLRPPVGSRNSHAKLTETMVRKILSLYQSGKMHTGMLARKFGVDNLTVWRIATGRSWKHLDIPRFSLPWSAWTQGERHWAAKLTDSQVRAIRREHIPYKVPYRVFSKRYGVSEQTVKSIVYRKAWTHV